MHPVDIKSTLDTMTILVDTREQPTPKLKKRLEATGRPYERSCLKSGDYSAKFILPDGEPYSLASVVAIERKMSIDEICGNFTRGRERFAREFQRMKDENGRIYLLIENATWENIYAGKYRSLLNPQSLAASFWAWAARYGTQIIFCRPETTGHIIAHILYYEMKERLERGDFDAHAGG